MVPVGVMRPRALLPNSVNQKLPSAALTILVAWAPEVSPENSVTRPLDETDFDQVGVPAVDTIPDPEALLELLMQWEELRRQGI
jgi:hypothetical protein